MKEKDKYDFNKAKDYCFGLFKFRLRTEKEIKDRLKRKRFKPQIIENLLSYLKDLGYINDLKFAKNWIEERLQKPYGLKRIIHELKSKGISPQIIEEEIQRLKKNYSEYEIVKGLVKEKLERFKGIDPEKTKKRIYSFLLRRGFSPEAILEAINELSRG